MSPGLRKFMLTLHVTASVGWLGAVFVFLVLSVAAVVSQEVVTVRAAYLIMDLSGRLILVPLSLASLLTGLIQSLGTPWGLFRHYWVLAKLVINVFASVILLLYTQTLSYMAGIAAETTLSMKVLGELKNPTAILHSTGGLVLLLLAILLSVYKPRGLTRYGWLKQQERRKARI